MVTNLVKPINLYTLNYTMHFYKFVDINYIYKYIIFVFTVFQRNLKIYYHNNNYSETNTLNGFIP